MGLAFGYFNEFWRFFCFKNSSFVFNERVKLYFYDKRDTPNKTTTIVGSNLQVNANNAVNSDNADNANNAVNTDNTNNGQININSQNLNILRCLSLLLLLLVGRQGRWFWLLGWMLLGQYWFDSIFCLLVDH
jgi:hypothetical protein